MNGSGGGRGYGQNKRYGHSKGLGRGFGTSRENSYFGNISHQAPAVSQNAAGLTPLTQGEETTLKAFVEESLCTGCNICANVCRYGAITMNGVAKVDLSRCTACGDCVNVCPKGAVTLRKA